MAQMICCCWMSRTTPWTCQASAGWKSSCALYVSHDRELLAQTATSIITLELGVAGNTAWTHPGGFDTYHRAREQRFERLDELRRRWGNLASSAFRCGCTVGGPGSAL